MTEGFDFGTWVHIVFFSRLEGEKLMRSSTGGGQKFEFAGARWRFTLMNYNYNCTDYYAHNHVRALQGLISGL